MRRMDLELWEDKIPGYRQEIPQAKPSLKQFMPDSGSARGAIIVCPGGGYEYKAAHEGEPIARWLNSLGLTAFVLDYRVSPYRYPIPVLDANRAVRWVRYHAENWHLDPNQIGLLGFSAGGHLAATVGTQFDNGQPDAADPVDRVSSRPDALILCYPVISLGQYGHRGSIESLLGPNPSDTLRQSLSNELRVTTDTPQTFLWHTANDGAVPVENSLMFAAALSRCRVPFAMHIFPDGHHGLGLADENPPVAVWTELCADWLKQIGFCD
ncbi:MAG TPA: alpha/beta hydrolase [Bacillota bacterium]